jgi:hypothetical protein
MRWVFIVAASMLATTAHAQSPGAGFETRPAGTLLVNDGVRIPAYVIAVEDAAGHPGDLIAPELSGLDMTVHKDLPEESAKYLSAYWTNTGWMLVPRGWLLVKAAVGADNSSAYEFKEPNGGKGRLSANDSGGACLGCALGLAAPFFPEARRQAADDNIPVSHQPMNGRMIALGKYTIAYSRKPQGEQYFDGIAYFYATDDVDAFTYEVSLPSSQHALATVILNWKLPPKSQR